MRPYGQQAKTKHSGCHCPECTGAPDKGSERMRSRVSLLPALGPVPSSVFLDTEAPCTCEDCTRDPGFAAYVRGLEQGEHDYLDAIG